jgi:hypothetical protein
MLKRTLLITILLLNAIPLFSAAISEKGVYWGAYFGDNSSALGAKKYDELTGKKMAQVMWFIDWNSEFPSAQCAVLYKNGYIPNITWEPWLYSDKNAINLDKIINGQFDEYINGFAEKAKKYGDTLFLRFGHEFNGDWYPWCVSKNGNDPQKFKKAWIHIHDIFKKYGADNVQWIWCPNSGSAITASWNDPLLAYPGDEYVDWIAIDGYNFGTYQSWSSWQSFSNIYRPMYEKLSAAITGKPFMVGEFACADKGGDKSQWISSLEDELKEFPLIKAVVWFDTNKEMDWRVSSSPETLAAFKKTISSPFFLSSAQGLESVIKNSLPAVTKKNKTSLKNNTVDPNLTDGKRKLILVKTVSGARIDGLFNEKIKTEPLLIGTSEDPLHCKIYMGYDSESIYVFADVTDPTPGFNTKKGSNIWDGDALEITLSTDPDADPARTQFGRFDFQIAIKASSDTETWNFTKKAPLEKSVIFYKQKKNGYTIEASIPWYNFNTGCFCRIKNKPIAFDAAIDDGDSSGKRLSQIRWSGNADFNLNPSQWGDVIFLTGK